MIKHRQILLTLLLTVPSWAGIALADTTSMDQARASLERFAAGLERFHAGFTQVVTEADGRVMEQGQGEVWMHRPDLFRWRYDGEFPELIVADGTRVWIHDQTLDQVTVRTQSVLPENSPLMLLTDPSALDRQFTVTELGSDDGTLLLGLGTDSRDAEFERVILGLREDQLSLMIMEDAFGMRTEIRFDNVRRNPDLAESLFRFSPPPGADIIGEAELFSQ